MQVVADLLRADVRGGPTVCNSLSNPIYCSKPSLGNELNITKSNSPPTTNVTIGGIISGLNASGLVLRNNGADDLTVPSGATSFAFATPVIYGGGYDVTVAQSPTGLTCTASNNAGTNVTTNVTDVSIVCSESTFTIGGTISGLNAAGLILRNNNDATTDIAIDYEASSFVFSAPVAFGGGYDVTVFQSPPGLTCTPSNNAGTNVTANVTDVSITCNQITYTIGGTISGLNAAGLILRNNNDNITDIAIDYEASSFVFSAPVAFGGGYNVTVVQSPASQTCTVSNGTGSNVMADVTNVQVDCALAVGDAFGGGVVYRIAGNIAYILSLADVSTSAVWGPTGPANTSVSNTFNTSTDNTYVALAGPTFPAAAACRGYETGSGADTWFLPAQNEWPLVVADIAAINSKSAITGFTQFSASTAYWSSTEVQLLPSEAILRSFSSPSASQADSFVKTSPLRIRCVRATTF